MVFSLFMDEIYPPSQKTCAQACGMNAKTFCFGGFRSAGRNKEMPHA